MDASHPIVEARERIGRERGTDRISQEEFGAELNVEGMTVSRWERGESLPRRKLWPKLEQLTGKPIHEIIARMKPQVGAQ